MTRAALVVLLLGLVAAGCSRGESAPSASKQPAGPTGDLMALYGPFSFISLHPVTAGASSSSSSSPGISVGIWIAIAAVIVILVGLWAYTRRRREAADEDRT